MFALNLTANSPKVAAPVRSQYAAHMRTRWLAGSRDTSGFWMKLALMLLGSWAFAATVSAATTINVTNQYAHGANIGWMDWRGNVANGAVIGEYVCSGFIYAANVGWINLGDGTPANGIRYQNNSGSDFGVNHDGTGNLRGYAWGANIGWLTFTNRDATGATYTGPRVNLLNGRLTGFVWSANCGWISLSNSFAHVRTDTLQPGLDTDGDGIADAYEYLWATNLTTMNGSSDLDGDGVPDVSEYIADTIPTGATNYLSITNYSVTFTSDEVHSLTWLSRPTRVYPLDHRTSLSTNVPWLPFGLVILGEPGPTTSALTGISPISDQRYWRVRASLPLASP